MTLVTEIVTFRTKAGADPAAIAEAAAQTTEWVARQPGFVARTLSLAEDGTWTDHVLWRSLEAAKAAATGFMTDPSTAAFVALIDGPSASMTHAQVLLRQPD